MTRPTFYGVKVIHNNRTLRSIIQATFNPSIAQQIGAGLFAKRLLHFLRFVSSFGACSSRVALLFVVDVVEWIFASDRASFWEVFSWGAIESTSLERSQWWLEKFGDSDAVFVFCARGWRASVVSGRVPLRYLVVSCVLFRSVASHSGQPMDSFQST